MSKPTPLSGFPELLPQDRFVETEVIASLIVLAGSVLALGWVAGKIYRIGILSSGNRPTFRQLARWVRTA